MTKSPLVQTPCRVVCFVDWILRRFQKYFVDLRKLRCPFPRFVDLARPTDGLTAGLLPRRKAKGKRRG